MTTPSSTTDPVRVEADFEREPSRWLWLLKWLLLVPHFVVLVFLWIAFVIATVVAFFAILFTEHYPRRLFAFNLGVLRWTWRVEYYGYGVLGTDHYPPFSLAEVPDHPAHLDIAYPERLSRGLVLVKWWLLALPHYLIVAILVSGLSWYGGLAGALVLIAAVALACTGRYPAGVFAFVMGLHRWLFRVVAYAALMTDSYPPFRLDQGGREPSSHDAPSSTPIA
jgi:hypothetical protein